MKHVLSAVFLVVFGLAASTWASPAEVQVSKEQLNGLEQLLLETNLDHLPLSDDDFDDNDDEPSRRAWNPINWIKNKLKNKCACEDLKCACCFKLKLFDTKACFNAETLTAEKKVQVSFTLDEKSLVNKRFDLNRDDSVCGNVPIPALTFLKYCFNQQTELDNSNVLTACSNVEFKVGGTTGAVIQFRCLELKEGKFTFGGYKELEKSSMLTLKAKNPFRAAVAMYKKAAGKKN